MIHLEASDIQLMLLALFIALAFLVLVLLKKAHSTHRYRQDEFDAFCENEKRLSAEIQARLQASYAMREKLQEELDKTLIAKAALSAINQATSLSWKNKKATITSLQDKLSQEKEIVMKLEKRIARVAQEHDALAKEAADINLENDQLRKELAKLKQEKDDLDDGFQDGADTRWKTRAINLNRQMNLLPPNVLREIRGQFNARIDRGVWDKARTPAHKVKIK